jgi:TolB-like protein
MKMKRAILLLLSVLLLLLSASCASSKAETGGLLSRDTGNLSARDIVSALSQQQETLIQSLPAGSRIAVLDIDAGDKGLNVFTTEEIIKTLVKTRQFRVLDRDSIETLRKEQNFQMSGEVDDATAVSIGKFMGASVVITGIIHQRYEQVDISLKILDVETTEIIDLISIPILNDRI